MAANSVGIVLDGAGNRLYGFDAELYLKEQAKRDPAWEKNIADWMEAVLGEPLPDREDMWVSLKSGIVLIKLLNKLKPGTIRRYNKTRLLPLLEMDNIQLFLKGLWKVGIKSSDMFITSDLYKRKGMTQVLNSVYALNLLAPSLGWKGPLISDALTNSKKRTKTKAKKWKPIEMQKTKRIDQVMEEQGGPKAMIHKLQLELAELKGKYRHSKGEIASLKQEIGTYKQKLGRSGNASRTDELIFTKRELVREKHEREQAEYELKLLRKRVKLGQKKFL